MIAWSTTLSIHWFMKWLICLLVRCWNDFWSVVSFYRDHLNFGAWKYSIDEFLSWLMDWWNNWWIDWFSGWMVDRLMDYLKYLFSIDFLLIDWLTGCFFIYLVISWLIYFLIKRFIGWFIEWFIDWPIYWFFFIVTSRKNATIIRPSYFFYRPSILWNNDKNFNLCAIHTTVFHVMCSSIFKP